MPSMQSTILLATTLLGSLLQNVAAEANSSNNNNSMKRAEVEFPRCISMCVRNAGCFDNDCICEKAGAGVLSEIVICMNQWCPTEVTAKDLIGPLDAKCDFPKSAVKDAEKKGGVASDEDQEEPAKPTTTPAPTPTGGKAEKEEEEIVMTFEVGKPQTFPAADSTTTVTPPVGSGTMTLPTDAAATSDLLIDTQSTKSLTTPDSTSATPTPSSDASSNDDDPDSAASFSGQASIFGVVAAMAAALALGF